MTSINGYTNIEQEEIVHLRKKCLKFKNMCLKLDNTCSEFEIKYSKLKDKCLKLENKCSELEDTCSKLKGKCSELENERNHYIHEGLLLDGLFEKYVGTYNVEDHALIVHHYVDNKSLFPYGIIAFADEYDGCVSVRGSWDNWKKDYTLKKKCVRESGIYEGYVYYIIEENIVVGNEYEFKFKDVDGNWIEPVDDGDTLEDFEGLVKVKENDNGSWNALITTRSYNDMQDVY